MKGRNLFLLGLLLGIIGVIVVVLFRKENPSDKELRSPEKSKAYTTMLAKETTRLHIDNIEGEIVPAAKRSISFPIDGVLEKGDVILKPGSHFKFNQLLYRVNINAIFQELSSAKNQLSTSIKGVMSDIERLFPTEKNKWYYFTERIDPAKRLPDFPILNSDEERAYFRSTTILKEYIKAVKLEAEIEKHFFLAPFDGYVLELKRNPGQRIRSGESIAIIAKEGKFNIQVICTESQANEWKKNGSLAFTDDNGNSIGKGTFLKSIQDGSDKGKKRAVFSFQAENNFKPQNGMKVITQISNSEKCYKLPASSVNNQKVKLLYNNQIIEREVRIIGSTEDSVYLKGLNENEIIVLN